MKGFTSMSLLNSSSSSSSSPLVVSVTRSLFLLLLLHIPELVQSHDCDNFDYLPTTEDLVTLFGLKRLADGSYYQETHRGSQIPIIDAPNDPDSTLSYTDASSLGMFLLTNEDNDYGWCWKECSAFKDDADLTINWDPCWVDCKNNETFAIPYGLSYFHRLRRDETWHFYFGDSIYLYELDNGALEDMHITILGSDVEEGQVLTHTVKAGTWFGAQVNPLSESDHPYALGATTYAPAYVDGDYELADVAYTYKFMEYMYVYAASKIKELSFYGDTDYTPSDNWFAEEGVNSLCHEDDDDDEEHDSMSLSELIDYYGMEEGPKGGSGYYAESYRSTSEVLTSYGGIRASMSAMYYAMNDTVFFHRQHSDETYHFYGGEPIILYEIDDTARPRVLKVVPIGSNVTIGEIPHYTVKAEHWVALEFKNNNYTYWTQERNETPVCLLGLTNGPGFDDKDLEFGVPEAMIENFPEFASTIASLYATGTAQGSGDAGCNMTTYNNNNITICGNSTYNGGSSFSELNTQNAAVAPEEKKNGGMVALYILVALACSAMIAMAIVKRRRNDKDENYPGVPDGITVVCERGGQVHNVETISVAGKSKGSISYIDFTGNIHSTNADRHSRR